MTNTEKPQTKPSIDAEYSAIAAAFRVAAKVLAIRFFLFLSLAGSFVLALLANNSQSPQSAWVLLLYAAVTTAPLTLLELWRKKGG